MIDKINAIKAEVEGLTASNLQEVEELRIKYLSKKGEVSALMQEFRTVPAEQKRELGQQLNILKEAVTAKLASLRETLENTDTVDTDLDLTRTAAPMPLGTRHPLSLGREEIISIFSRTSER
ncbi:MAG: phenylalanine--tRNA ligase subunit alpha, partial [Duncaniella sp.]|nr:phenylalanine--tRNA ligase subunit alpha [Duncaniella sp.]